MTSRHGLQISRYAVRSNAAGTHKPIEKYCNSINTAEKEIWLFCNQGTCRNSRLLAKSVTPEQRCRFCSAKLDLGSNGCMFGKTCWPAADDPDAAEGMSPARPLQLSMLHNPEL